MDAFVQHTGVNHRCAEVLVTEEFLDCSINDCPILQFNIFRHDIGLERIYLAADSL